MKKIATFLGLLTISILISACSGVLSSEQPVKQYYLLEPVSIQPPGPADLHWPALVLSLSAVPGLDTDRIQAIDADARLNHYANARWADFLPEVLSSVIRRSLASSGYFAAVTTTAAPAKDSWSLALEVQQFYGIQSTAGTTSRVTAEFDGLLHCNDQDHLVHVSASSAVKEERLAVVVEAHQAALDDSTHQLWDQIKTLCQ